MDKKNNDNKHQEFIKIVYEQGAEHHRHYLSWREKLIGGYVAIVAALIIALSWLYTHPQLHEYLFLVFLILVFISYGFRELERRNHYASIDVQNVLLTIEKEIQLSQSNLTNKNTSLFFSIDNSFEYWNLRRKKNTSHSYILGFTYDAVMMFSAISTFGCIFWYNLHWSQKIIAQEWIQIIFKILLCLVGIGVIIFALIKISIKRITRKDREDITT